MSEDLIHFTDSDGEGKYHILCSRPWRTTQWCEPEKVKEGLCKCSDGSYFSRDKEKVNCPGCRAKLN